MLQLTDLTVALVDTLTAQMNFINAQTQGSHTCMYNVLARVTHVPLLFSATSFLCITLMCETENF